MWHRHLHPAFVPVFPCPRPPSCEWAQFQYSNGCWHCKDSLWCNKAMMKIWYQQYAGSAEKTQNSFSNYSNLYWYKVLEENFLKQAVLRMWPVIMAGINSGREGGMAEKITHPILVGLLHPEKGSFQSCTSFCRPASQATSAVDVSGCVRKCDTIRVTVTAAPGGGTLHLHSPTNKCIRNTRRATASAKI